MPQNTTITLTAGVWTQLTDADINSITFQNRGGTHMFVSGTADVSAPSNFNGAIRYNPGQGERNISLIDLFPGLTGVDRLWAFSDSAIDVMISHA